MSTDGMSYTLKGLRGLRTRRRKSILLALSRPIEDSADVKAAAAATLSGEEKITLVTGLLEETREYDRAILGHSELTEDGMEEELDGIEEFEAPVRIELAKLRTAKQESARAGASALYHTAQPETPVGRRVTFGVAQSTPLGFPSVPEHRVPIQQLAYRPPKELDIAPEKFSGERLKFRQFRTQFELWVGRQPTSTPRERLMVLKKYVTGDPKALIEPLELTDSNYTVAWSLLESNFSRVETERERILAELMNLPRVTNPYDAKSLRNLLTIIQKNTQILEAMGLPLGTCAPMVKSAITAALPERTRQDFKDSLRLEERLAAMSLAGTSGHQQTETTTDGSQNNQQSTLADSLTSELEKLLAFLKLKVNDLEDSKFLESAINPSAARPGDGSARKGQVCVSKSASAKRTAALTVAGISANTSSKKKFPPRPCLFCKTSEHNSSKCPAQISYDARCEVLKQQKRCLRCFRAEHGRETDCRGPRSPCSRCKSTDHYSSMHREQTTASSAPVVSETVAGATARESTLIMTAMAHIVNGGLRVPVRVFFDGGSTLSFITPRARRVFRNERPVQRAKLAIEGFASIHDIDTERFNIRLAGSPGEKPIEILAYEHDFGVSPRNSCPTHIQRALKLFAQTHLLADPTLLESGAPPSCDILIGRDQMCKFVYRRAPKIVVDNVEAYETGFGWAVAGPTAELRVGPKATVASIQAVCCSVELSQPARDLEILWNLDGIATPSEETGRSADEESAMKQFEEGVVYESNRYTVDFPKRPSIATLPNNKSVAFDRLSRKTVQLRRNPSRYRTYHKEIMKFVEQGYAVEIPCPNQMEADQIDGTYYIPHHEVVTSAVSGEKWRVVFDCSARAKGATSLNDHLLIGPNLNPELVTLLINFRLHRIAVTADITKAYMMIQVSERDRRFFRFLWQAPDEQRVRCFQMSRVTWGAASSGFILAATIRKHFKQEEPDHQQEMASCLYADDFVKSFPTVELATEFTDRLQRVLRSAGMSLAKWKTNSSLVTEHLLASGTDPTGLESSPSSLFKVLGIQWSPGSDVLSFDLSAVGVRAISQKRPTKRLVLSLVASVYDPLGLLTPFTIRGRRIIQRLWSADLQWNDPVTEESSAELAQWLHEIEVFSSFKVPRQYASRLARPVSYRLHVFGDASPIAYAACAYIEYVYPVCESSFCLVMCKSKLAPRAKQSLPRLELLAAVIGVRLKTFLIERFAITFESVSFYTDSMITYHWATATQPGRWRTFVANRVSEIQARSAPEDWYFVPGEDNVADLATRGIPASTLAESNTWWSGPAWLRRPRGERPTSRPRGDPDSFDSVSAEVRATVAAISTAQPLIDLERFGTLGKASRVVAYVLRFIKIVTKKPAPKMTEAVKLAEVMIIRWCQEEYFPKEREAAAAKERVHSSSKLAAFNLFIDESGLLRARTRLTLGPMYTFNEKNPVVVPGESRVAKLIVLEAHRVNAHFGVTTVLSQIRRRFWITRARQIIRAVLRKCVVCRKAQGPAAAQQEAPLPPERVTLVAPFAVAGLDFCGPFFVRMSEGKRKVYVALFTCTSTRAVHLESVPSLETIQTHLALRRFLSSYPACVKFISDNAKSFIKASTDLKRVFNTVNAKEVRELLGDRRIDWEFISPRSPWRGGMYERLVGTFKRALTKTLGSSFIGFEEFRTIVTELSAVINQRPITPVSNDVDSLEALTPAHFLRGGPSATPLATVLPLDRLGPQGAVTGAELRDHQLQRTSYFKALSVRWFREYILALRSANTTRGSESLPIVIGDLCLMKEDNLPRIRWNLVRVMDAHTGRDGIIRTYTVRLANGNVTKRAAQLLYPLELIDRPNESREAPE